MDRQRNKIEKKISSALYYHLTRFHEWEDPRHCLLVTGQKGSGKTIRQNMRLLIPILEYGLNMFSQIKAKLQQELSLMSSLR